ncbi:M20 family metallopeptidase [Phaeobacter porticola]|uniref:Acetylornithine deacetylase ArgE n=1 Tax=Phaeobacter porticola TaxID=1844006 RepID=A0A1L3I779_9RHOB|nr:M20/M25/M40 family metallo-hydrolase [Phaeobacter porticola]APG47943.1 acetylornithine deacetylase ArgE [Phaeobacter porticola]
MIIANEWAEKLDAALDKAKAIALLKGAVARNSITGNEANFTAFLNDEMLKRGCSPQTEEFLPGRPNIWGARTGTGTGKGKRLQFIGHTDTVHVEGWSAHWAGTSREDPFGGAIVDDAMWGRGVTDLKGGICAALSALDLLDTAGISLTGDVAFAFVGDEESGEDGSGVSAGIDHWTRKVQSGEIARPDFAIYVEPTNLSVYAAQIGFFIADVTVSGRSAYFGRPDLGLDALKATHSILAKVWQHAETRQSLTPHPLTGQSSVLVTGLQGGGYIAVPGECRFSVIGSLRPGDTIDQAVAEFEAAVRAAPNEDGIEIDIRYPAGRDHPRGGTAAEISTTLPEIDLLISTISSAKPKLGHISGAPFWSESSFLINKLGVPTVYCAPGDIACCHTPQEHLSLEEYFTAIRAYARFMVAYCGTSET